MELTNDNVRIRTPIEDDATAVAAAVRASLEAISPWMVWATPDYGPAEALQWITNQIPGDDDAVPFVILDDEDDIVGACGLNHLDQLNLLANLGYWLRPDRTGRGYASGAANLVASWGIEHLGLQRVEIIMSVENNPSRRVAERVGATYEGILHKRLRYQGRQHDAHSFAFLAADDDSDDSDADDTGNETT